MKQTNGHWLRRLDIPEPQIYNWEKPVWRNIILATEFQKYSGIRVWSIGLNWKIYTSGPRRPEVWTEQTVPASDDIYLPSLGYSNSISQNGRLWAVFFGIPKFYHHVLEELKNKILLPKNLCDKSIWYFSCFLTNWHWMWPVTRFAMHTKCTFSTFWCQNTRVFLRKTPHVGLIVISNLTVTYYNHMRNFFLPIEIHPCIM